MLFTDYLQGEPDSIEPVWFGAKRGDRGQVSSHYFLNYIIIVKLPGIALLSREP